MKRHQIAGLIVDMDPHLPLFSDRTKQYESSIEGNADMTIPYREEWYCEKNKEHSHLTMEETEYIWSGEEFYLKLLLFGGFMLHSSAVVHDGYAYLFSAPSGTGKSTHTNLWLNAFPDSFILNDDKPAVRLIDGKFYACGTPWSGKHDISKNDLVPVAGLAFLERDTVNHIAPMASTTALFKILSQTVRPYDPSFMDKLLDLLDVFIKTVPIHLLGCNMEPDAATTAFAAMNPKNNAPKMTD